MNLENMQRVMTQDGIDGWLVYDFQSKNPILSHFFQPKSMLTRRVFLLVPAIGQPQLVASRIDRHALSGQPYPINFYVSWQEMQNHLSQLLADWQTVAMDYSPNCELPTVSRVDAGTVEMIRAMGKQVVSAANVFQAGAAVWGPGVLEAHLEDCQRVAAIKDAAFSLIEQRLHHGQSVTEYDVQEFIMQQFEQARLTTPYPPIVAANAHSGDPHYSPSAKQFAPIQKGDWILIDLWAKRPGDEFVFADMTWVGVAAPAPTNQQQAVFDAVKAGRDRAVTFIKEQLAAGAPIEGWQVDDAVRHVITQAGFGEAFIHRTGHSLGPGSHVHGVGVNIDNLETHDTRRLIPGLGFTIEPGVYLPEFGVRLEINAYMADDAPRITTPVQQSIICMAV